MNDVSVIRQVTMTMKICLLPWIYIYTRYRMQDINTLEISIKHYSFSGSELNLSYAESVIMFIPHLPHEFWGFRV